MMREVLIARGDSQKGPKRVSTLNEALGSVLETARETLTIGRSLLKDIGTARGISSGGNAVNKPLIMMIVESDIGFAVSTKTQIGYQSLERCCFENH